MSEYKIEVLKINIEGKKREIEDYEMTLFNYEYMLLRTQDNDFKQYLTDNIQSNIRELNKTKLILEAFQAQLATLE